MVGSTKFTMHKRAGDSNLATLSASSPVLREIKDSNQHRLTIRRVWRVRRSLELVSLPSVPRGSGPRACMVAPRRQHDVFFRLLTRVARRNNARYRIAARARWFQGS